jgi:hypothetical protein
MLRFASFATCDFPQIDAAPALLLPRLKQLRLFDVGITKTAMHRLFAALEGLQLQGISGFSTLSIASRSLRTIGRIAEDLMCFTVWSFRMHLPLRD